MWGGLLGCGPAFQRVPPAEKPAAGRIARPTSRLLNINRDSTLDDSRLVDDLHPLSNTDDPRHCDYLEAGKVILMPPPARPINYCFDPNAYDKTMNGERQVPALREIPAGEEITYDYCINSSATPCGPAP